MVNRNVFINCPFSTDYQDKFRAIVFTVIRSGFAPRCALESDDSSENRFEKICKIIGECRFGVHDISKTTPDELSGLPRFNMPLELGLFLAAKRFGGALQKSKQCIIFDLAPYRYQQFMSDISGQDIHSHGGSVRQLISGLAAWFRQEAKDESIPGGAGIYREFTQFAARIPTICAAREIDEEELTFQDYRALAANWIVSTQK